MQRQLNKLVRGTVRAVLGLMAAVVQLGLFAGLMAGAVLAIEAGLVGPAIACVLVGMYVWSY